MRFSLPVPGARGASRAARSALVRGFIGCLAASGAAIAAPNISVSARGTLAENVGPVMQLWVDGKLVGSQQVRATTFTAYTFDAPGVKTGSKVDVVFSNDKSNKATREDRNLFVQSVSINSVVQLPTAPGVTFDRGFGAAAFDGKDVFPGQGAMYWSGALRFMAPGTPPPAPAAVVPASAVAPWLVFRQVNALAFASRSGLETVWGDYWERTDDLLGVEGEGQTQELGMTGSGNHASYASVDLGTGVDSFMLRVSLPAGTQGVEFRLGSATGTLLGRCNVPGTGDKVYRIINCPVDAALARGVKTVVVRFTGSSPGLRFNWFAFWARGTVVKIDEIQKAQSTGATNKPAPQRPLAGTPVRTRSLLPGTSQPVARSYGLYQPTQAGDCPKWLHDTYWTTGEDGKVYPTWHPPADFNPDTGTYCTYGHEHGDDPRGSDVFALAGMPAFGFVNENHSPTDAAQQRNEDHVGHKVRVANDWTMYEANKPSVTRSCDLLFKMHMGTHSPDALTNTAHEMFVAGQCAGLQPFNVKHFALFGQPGVFKEAEAQGCNREVYSGIAPVPYNQANGGVHRAIPTRDCFLRGTTTERAAAVDRRAAEFWLTSFVGGSFYFTIQYPSRVYDPSAQAKISRTVDLCYSATEPLAATLDCQATMNASPGRIAWNDVRSSFRGSRHDNTHFSGVAFGNSSSAVVYSDAYGQKWQSTPDAARGIVFKQTVPRTGFAYRVDGHASVLPYADYSAGGRNGVRAPN